MFFNKKILKTQPLHFYVGRFLKTLAASVLKKIPLQATVFKAVSKVTALSQVFGKGKLSLIKTESTAFI